MMRCFLVFNECMERIVRYAILNVKVGDRKVGDRKVGDRNFILSITD